MADILKFMADMKATLQPTTPAPTTESLVYLSVHGEGSLAGITVCDASCRTESLSIPLAKGRSIVSASDISAAMDAEAEVPSIVGFGLLTPISILNKIPLLDARLSNLVSRSSSNESRLEPLTRLVRLTKRESSIQKKKFIESGSVRATLDCANEFSCCRSEKATIGSYPDARSSRDMLCLEDNVSEERHNR